mmetsp:Transcript_145344/g.465699  ORF Transcript_145344/g.465699 Transcript_145344/m.465699 type:complete len:89 (+) Transcript_145344:212-478(+)
MHEEVKILRHLMDLLVVRVLLQCDKLACWRTTSDEEKNIFTVDEEICNGDLTNRSEELTVQSDYINMETETHEREWRRTWRNKKMKLR